MLCSLRTIFYHDLNLTPPPFLMKSWRYDNLGDLEHVATKEAFKKANTGLAHTYQVINVEDFEVRHYISINQSIRFLDFTAHVIIVGTWGKHPNSIFLSEHGRSRVCGGIVSIHGSHRISTRKD